MVAELLQEALFPYSVDVVDDGPEFYPPLKEDIARVGWVVYEPETPA